MTINLDTEVQSRFDLVARVCHYTVERDGRHWTVSIPLTDLDKHKANKTARRNHLGSMLTAAMSGPSDEEKASA